MKRIGSLWWLAGVLLAGCTVAPEWRIKPVELSRSLDRWQCFLAEPGAGMNDVWRLEDGVLVCSGSPLGYLYTRDAYTNFVLTLEWRWPEGTEGGKGGVLIRQTGEHRIWPTSLEAQLNAGQAGDFWGLAGYGLTGPDDRMESRDHETFGKLTNLKKLADCEKPAGAWNRYEIIAQGDTVTLRINGQEVNEAAGCAPNAGSICLTAEGSEIHFRAIRVIALGASAPH
jgi:hypothetical protein